MAQLCCHPGLRVDWGPPHSDHSRGSGTKGWGVCPTGWLMGVCLVVCWAWESG